MGHTVKHIPHKLAVTCEEIRAWKLQKLWSHLEIQIKNVPKYKYAFFENINQLSCSVAIVRENMIAQ